MTTLEKIRPSPDNDIRQMPTADISKRVVMYVALSAAAWGPATSVLGATSLGANLLSAIPVGFALPGLIELFARWWTGSTQHSEANK